MRAFDFTLKFKLPEPGQIADHYLDDLFQHGCDDALIGTGLSGRIALDFTRQSADAKSAVLQAITQVQSAIPGAKLIEASPDLVGTSDISACLGISRQAIQKTVATRPDFPCALHSGQASIWHLAEVLDWYGKHRQQHIDPSVSELARINLQLNLLSQQDLLDQKLKPEILQRMQQPSSV